MLGVGAGEHRAGVAAAAGLREREGGDLVALGEGWDEALDLLPGAVGDDRQRARARVDGERDAHAGVGAGELLEDEDVAEEVGAGAADVLRDADAHEAELAELGEDVLGEAVLAVPLGRVRRDDLVGEPRGQRADLVLLVGQLVAVGPAHGPHNLKGAWPRLTSPWRPG